MSYSSQKCESTFFDYQHFTQVEQDLEYQGDAHVPTCKGDLRLTKTDNHGRPQQGSVGRVVYSPPVQFWRPGNPGKPGEPPKQATFETTFKFIIKNVDNTPADGIVFFIAPVDYDMGAPGGSLGIYDASGKGCQVFAAEVDPYDNSWDPPSRHIGININSRISSAHEKFEYSVGKEVIVNVTYDVPTRKITVVAKSGSQTSIVHHVVDLKSILRDEEVQVGISSATGENVAIHDLKSWCFTSTLVPDELRN